MARKPLSGTVAKTVLEHGTGGINIDGCRIPFAGDTDLRLLYGGGTDILRGNYVGATHGNGKENIEANDLGRWPANVIIDEEAATMIDQQTGKLTSGAMTKSYEYTNNGFSLGKPSGSTKQIHEANSGGGSRFFYCAKPSKEERNKGCEQMEQKPSGVKNASGRGYSESDPYKQVLNQNTHPTVKPISLMRYLVKMVTPPGGHCCDPFIGSGTTHIACELEGFECTGIDDDQESILIAKARSKGWADEIAAAAYLRTHPKAPPESVKNLTADQISFLAGNIQTSLFL
jgi:site-specific DNA-methyltransferase (adenine-specific)